MSSTVTSQMKPSPRVFQKHKEPGRETNGNSDIDVSHAITYADIEIHVPNFKALTSWWLNTHSDYNSLRVTEALMHVPKTLKTTSKSDTASTVEERSHFEVVFQTTTCQDGSLEVIRKTLCFSCQHNDIIVINNDK